MVQAAGYTEAAPARTLQAGNEGGNPLGFKVSCRIRDLNAVRLEDISRSRCVPNVDQARASYPCYFSGLWDFVAEGLIRFRTAEQFHYQFPVLIDVAWPNMGVFAARWPFEACR